MSELKLQKCSLVTVPYEHKLAPIDRHINAISIDTGKLINGYLSTLGHLDIPQRFYLVSNRPIKLNDWVYYVANRLVIHVTNDVEWLNQNPQLYRKVEAYHEDPRLEADGMPKIPPTFFGKFSNKIFDVKQVNIEMELLLGNVDFTDKNNPINHYTPKLRSNNTVIMSRVLPNFSLEDLVKAFNLGKASTNPEFSTIYNKNIADVLNDAFDFDLESYNSLTAKGLHNLD